MKNSIALILLLIFSSCSTTRDKINEANERVEAFKRKAMADAKENAKGPEKLRWFTALVTPQGIIKQEINKSIIKVSNDIYCAFEKEHKQGPFEMHPGMRSKVANCIFLKEDFQLHTVCDKENKIILVLMGKEERELNFKLSIQCELE